MADSPLSPEDGRFVLISRDKYGYTVKHPTSGKVLTFTTKEELTTWLEQWL